MAGNGMHAARRWVPALLLGIAAAAAPAAGAQPSGTDTATRTRAHAEAPADTDELQREYLETVVAGLDGTVNPETELSRLLLARIVAAQAAAAAGARADCRNDASDDDDVCSLRREAAALAWRLIDDSDAPVYLQPVLLASGLLDRGSPVWRSTLDVALQRQPDNLAVADWQLDAEVAPDDAAAFDAWLESSTAMERFDSHHSDTVRMLFNATRAHPLPPPLRASALQLLDLGEDDADLVQLILPIGIATAQVMPALGSLGMHCNPERATHWTQDRAANCLQLARTLALQSDTEIGEATGLAMWRRLADDDELAEVEQRHRARHWRREATLAIGEQALARAWLRAIDAGLGEREAQAIVLSEAGVPAEPPPDWQPQSTP